MDLSEAEINALRSDTTSIGIFFRMGTEPPIRLWLGVGEIQPGINAYDDANETYFGLGTLIDVPALQQLINGVADRITFQLSGVSEEVLITAAGEADSIKNATVAVGICIFGRDWVQLGVPKWMFRGRADYLTINQQSGEGNQMLRVVELSVGSLLTGRRRRGLSYMTDEDQQERFPGDLMCERTALYTNGVEKVWPRLITP